MSSPLYFEDLNVGDTWTSSGRTITETDVVQFAGMTGDFNPLHVDQEHAKGTPFRKVVAHGLLGLSWVAGLGSHSPRVHTAALVGIDAWEFAHPVFIGDTVHVETEVMKLEPNGRRRGKVVWRRRLLSQEEKVLQQGRFVTLVYVREPRQVRVDEAESKVPRPHLPISSR